MEQKENTSWGDYKLTIGGEEIQCFTDPASSDGDSSTVSAVTSKNGELTILGTLSFSKKNIKRMQKLFKGLMAKKRRLPRKLKKKIKKQNTIMPTLIKYIESAIPYGFRPQVLGCDLRCRCYVEPLKPPVSKEYLDRFTADDIEKMIKSFDTQPTLPRDTGNRPNFIIIDDVE